MNQCILDRALQSSAVLYESQELLPKGFADPVLRPR